MSRILIIQGHPDPSEPHFCHALADAYATGAAGAGHTVARLELAAIDFPLLHSQKEQEGGPVPAGIAAAQAEIKAADHLVLVFPLWLGGMPGLVKAFFEQALRPGFAYSSELGPFKGALLKGRSLRIVITMGMPAWFYRLVYGAHSLKAMKVGIFAFVGFKPIRASLIGNVAGTNGRGRERWIASMKALGAAAA
ncbi:MAG: NAD(P)H-dependent oxidoreductase [Hydrogenophaga sp.]|nr:NAD(P)H-dependent oxidoreductase [Hydrogenophaga sp.]